MHLLKKFWKFVDKQDRSECWIWKGGKNPYGKASVNGKHMGAHRLSYQLFKGIIPIGMQVLHRCDNKPCVNPDHLFLGTAKDNLEDAISKNRLNVHQSKNEGEKNGRRKITEDDVRSIRQSSESTTVLAKKYGLERHQIRLVQRRVRWSHI